MARYIFPQGRLLASAPAGGTGLAACNGLLVRVYTDSAASLLADILTLGGSPIVNSELTVDATSQLPLFQGPDGVGTLYVKAVAGGPISTINARLDSIAPVAGNILTTPAGLDVSVTGRLGVGATPGSNLILVRGAGGRDDLVVKSTGRVGVAVATGATPSGLLDLRPYDASTKGLFVRAFSAGDDTLHITDSAGVPVVQVSAAGLATFTTDGSRIAVLAKATALGTGSIPVLKVESNDGNKRVFEYKIVGDAVARLALDATGGAGAGGATLQFGDGATLDTNLYWAAAGILATDHTLQFTEHTDAAAPAANKARLYAKDNGAGKTQLVVRFPTGAVQVLATEP